MNDKVRIHPSSDVQSLDIGDGTVVWQFCVILPEAKIGANCNINCHCFIENKVVIGDNVTIKSGVYLWDGLTMGSDVFVGPNVSFINDKYPKSKQYPNEYLKTVVGNGVSIGAGAIIMGGVTIGENTLIGAGSLVTKSVPANSVCFGSPAQVRKTHTNGEWHLG